MKTIDISPKSIRLQAAADELFTPPLDIPIGQRIGGLAMNSNSFIRGTGDQVFGSSQKGIWLGKANFEDAPFSVDMNGNANLQSATFKDSNGIVIIDGSGLTSSNFNSSSDTFADNSNQHILTVEPIYTLIANAQIPFTLQKATKIIILFTASAWITRQSGSGNYGCNARFALFIDNVNTKGYLLNGSKVGTDSTGSLDASSIVTIAHIASLPAGVHTIQMKAALNSVTGSPALNIFNHTFSRVNLG